jgi:hypothetical protein
MRQGIYIIKKNWVQFLSALSFIIGGVWLLCYFGGFYTSVSEHWSKWLEPYLSVALIVIALFIWYNEQREEWLKSLPKRLNSSYWIKDIMIMESKNVVLINESDIRAWGQQIGAQMGNERQLSFELHFEIINPRKPIKIHGQKVLLYELKMFLKTPPSFIGLNKEAFDSSKTLKWIQNEKGELVQLGYFERNTSDRQSVLDCS